MVSSQAAVIAIDMDAPVKPGHDGKIFYGPFYFRHRPA
jgi:hypothetical protein